MAEHRKPRRFSNRFAKPSGIRVQRSCNDDMDSRTAIGFGFPADADDITDVLEPAWRALADVWDPSDDALVQFRLRSSDAELEDDGNGLFPGSWSGERCA